jgi:hypothetical protein
MQKVSLVKLKSYFFYICCRSNYLFWRKGVSLEVTNNQRSHEIKEWQVHGPNIHTFVVVTGVEWYYAMGC